MSPRFLGGRDYHDTSKSKNNVNPDIHNTINVKIKNQNGK